MREMLVQLKTKDQAEGSRDVLAHRRWLVVAQAVWVVLAVLALLTLIAGIPLGYAQLFSGTRFYAPVDAPPWYIASVSIMQGIVSFAAALVSLALAGIVFWKKRQDLGALLVSFFLLAYGTILAGPLEALSGFPPLFPGASPPSGKLIPTDVILALQSAIMLPTILLFFLFPTGRFVPPWTRYATVVLLLVAPLFIYVTMYEWLPTTTPLTWFTFAVVGALLGAGGYSQIYRYRHVAGPIERQKTKWVVFGLLLTFFILGVSQIPYAMISQIPVGALHPWWEPLSGLIWWISISILPFSFAIAVMGYRLGEIDLVINRALVYGSLTAFVVGVYVVVVALLGALVRGADGGSNLLISLFATAAIAVLFQPLRERLQRAVNRLTYGERDDPYAVISRLGQRLESSLAPDAVLPTIVEIVAQALKVPYVAIDLTTADGRRTMDTQYPVGAPRPEATVSLPLVFQHETLGALIVAPRLGEGKLSDADLRLLKDLARQAGVAVHAVQLTTDLQRSREQIVTAREEERRRLRRDLHDGLGPTLAALALTAGTVRDLIPTDPDTASALAKELQGEIRGTIAEIRRLVYALRPPALDELGLVAAIREAAIQSGRHARAADARNELRVQVDAADTFPPLPAAVEVAAFRIAQEALTNVIRHAHARNCTIRINLDNTLSVLGLEIFDDGVGLPAAGRSGVGLVSIRERAEELGGSCIIETANGAGTRILARFPIRKGE